MNAVEYFVVALLVVVPDAILCYALKRRFRAARCLVFATFWPVTLPFIIVASAAITRSHPDVGDSE